MTNQIDLIEENLGDLSHLNFFHKNDPKTIVNMKFL